MDVQRDHVLHSENGRFTGKTSSQPGDLPRILNAALDADPAAGLVIHFHGGLVGQKAGRAIADRLAPRYAKAGAYPLFFVWEAGPLETIVNNLGEFRSDPAFQELVKKVSEWVAKKLGAQIGLKGGGGRAVDEAALRREFDAWFAGAEAEPPLGDGDGGGATPASKGAAGLDAAELADEIEAGFDADPRFQDSIQELHAAADTGALDAQARAELFPGQGASTKGLLSWAAVARFVTKIVLAVLHRFAQGRAHGAYCTVIEEVLRAAYLDRVGTVIWNRLKEDAGDAFAIDPMACGHDLVQELARQAAAGRSFRRITLIGHSTGAIFICELLDALAAVLPAQAVDIVFLAPAVTHERFARALDAHRERIANLRVFAMSDALESRDRLVPVLYTRSLLYFVSGVLEGRAQGDTWQAEVDAPLVGMARYLEDVGTYNATAFPFVETVRHELGKRPASLVLAESTAGDGLHCRAHKHGGFDDDGEPTVDSLCCILSQGFTA